MHTNLDELIEKLQTSQMDKLDKIADRLSIVRRTLTMSLAAGQIQKAQKSAQDASDLLEQEKAIYKEILSDLQTFGFEKYIDTQFDAAFKEACQAAGITLCGSFPHYTVAPIGVDVLPNAHCVEINGREIELGRIATLVKAIQDELSALEKNGIPPNEFLTRIVQAYDHAVEESTGHKPSEKYGLEIPLKSIYAQLIPKRTDQFKYSLRNFSYDIYQLQSEGLRALDGRKIVFKAGKNQSNAIRIFLPNGREVYYSSISMVKQEVETKNGTQTQIISST